MNKWQNKIYRFMYGRYWFDELYKFNLFIYFLLLIINLFLNSIIIIYIEIFLLFIIFYRLFSKKISKRKKENDIYLSIKKRISNFLHYRKLKWQDRNTKLYKKCPKCKTILRLPLKKGKHTVKCPTCHYSFTVKCRKNEKIKIEIIK